MERARAGIRELRQKAEEELTWKEAQAVNTEEGYRRFFAAYPQGRFVASTQEKLLELQRGKYKEATESKPEEQGEKLEGQPALLEQFKRLSQLREKGLLTEHEFTEQKRKLLPEKVKQQQFPERNETRAPSSNTTLASHEEKREERERRAFPGRSGGLLYWDA